MKWMLLCWMLLAPWVRAADALPMAEDPQVEARLVVIAEELRCLVCQNESLASSHAELAEDLRREVRKLIRDNKSYPISKNPGRALRTLCCTVPKSNP